VRLGGLIDLLKEAIEGIHSLRGGDEGRPTSIPKGSASDLSLR
jgi:hypothetical protein